MIAANDCNRIAFGFEIKKYFYGLAKKRIEDFTAQGKLFDAR